MHHALHHLPPQVRLRVAAPTSTHGTQRTVLPQAASVPSDWDTTNLDARATQTEQQQQQEQQQHPFALNSLVGSSQIPKLNFNSAQLRDMISGIQIVHAAISSTLQPPFPTDMRKAFRSAD
eukprot:3031359-Rhodomonas_salina.2